MNEYLEREALLEEIDRKFEESPVENTNAWMVGRRIVRKFPASDVELVKHGHWKLIPCVCSGLDVVTYECSGCKKYVHLFDDEDIYESCPHCRAKMDEEIAEE